MFQSIRKNKSSFGAFLAIVAYLLMASIKLYFSHRYASGSLRSDGLNNLSDIIGTVSIFMGLLLASRPADDNHRFGHLKYEAIASFISAMLMFSIGFDVLRSAIDHIWQQSYPQTDARALYVGIASAIFLSLVRTFILNMTKDELSIGLKASMADMKNDIYISLSTVVGTLFVRSGYPIIDVLLSLFIACLIIKSAYDIFKESSFLLSDGFDQELLQAYKATILKHPKVIQVRNLRGRFY